MNTSSTKLNDIPEIELIYTSRISPVERPYITSSKDAYDILLNAWDKNKLELLEQSKVVLLNRANRVLGICNLSSGGISGTVVDLKHAFVAAMKANASSIIIAHNHPSSQLRPSEADKRLTTQFKEAGKILDLPVLDHIIVTPSGFYSFADEGLFFS